MVSSAVEGTTRTVVAAAGAFFLEEILAIDHDRRTFEYRITGPMVVHHHRGRISVLDDDAGSRVVYEQEIDPKALASVLDGAIGDALEGLRDLVLHGRTSRAWAPPRLHRRRGGFLMARRILFVTTDQQRYDALGCNGGRIARTPVVDRLATTGIRYERAVPQNVVCMPSRATMLTGSTSGTTGSG